MGIRGGAMLELKFKKATFGAKNPKYATDDASCFDLYANHDAIIKPSETVVVGTGIIFEPPKGYGIMLYPRSGISSKTPLRFANSVGVIDNDYRGEVKVILENVKPKDYKLRVVPSYMTVDGEEVMNDYKYGQLPEGTIVIKKGDRIAQAMPIKIDKVKLVQSKILSETERGEGGLGSTGTK